MTPTETPEEGETPTETPEEGETPTETPEEGETTPGGGVETPTDNETTVTPSVTIDDQETDGQTVTVANVTLADGGYVVIYNESLAEGEMIQGVVGVSEYLEAGTYDNVTITLFDVPGAENETTGTETPGTATPATETPETETPAADNETANEAEMRLTESQTLTARLHNETGDDQTFEFVATNGLLDGSVIVDNMPVEDTANVTVGNETATDGTPTEETATEGTPTEETPTEATPTEETPTGTETPTQTGL